MNGIKQLAVLVVVRTLRGRARPERSLAPPRNDVVRGIGAPDNVGLSNNPRGDRVAVVSYSHGQRAGIYTFTAGRLTSIERAPEAAAPVRGAKPKKKPAA